MRQRKALLTTVGVVTCLCMCWAIGSTAADERNVPPAPVNAGSDQTDAPHSAVLANPPTGGSSAAALTGTHLLPARRNAAPQAAANTSRNSIGLGDGIHSLEGSGLTGGSHTPETQGRGGCVGNTTLTQNANPVDIISGNTPACGSGTPRSTTENAYGRCFDLSTGPIAGLDLNVNCVEFAIESSSDNVEGPGAPFTVQVRLYTDSDGCPPLHPDTDMVLLAEVDVVIPDETSLTLFQALFPATLVPANSKLVVELWADNRQDLDGGSTYFGSNPDGETAPSYLRAVSCGLVNYQTLASIGWADTHMVMSVIGDTSGVAPDGACCVDGVCVGTMIYDDCIAQCGEWTVFETCPEFQCPAACIVPCDPEKTPEGEPVCGDEYDDTYNGGCNSTVPVFQSIACGARICGESGTFLVQGDIPCVDDIDCPEGETCDLVSGFCTGGPYPFGSRDTDWYEIVLDQEVTIVWDVVAEFPLQMLLIDSGDGTCVDGSYSIETSATAPPCVPANITASLAPGTYWLWVGPSVFECVPCGKKYNMDLECFGRDVFPSNLEIMLEIDNVTPGIIQVNLSSAGVSSYAEVLRDPPPYSSGTPIQTEIVAMELTGFDQWLGPITVTESPILDSTGAITNVVAAGGFFQSGDSSFDMWPDIVLGHLPELGVIITKEPHHMTADGITNLPPWGAIYEWIPGGVECKGDMDGDNDIDGDDIWLFVNCLLGLNPPPADCQLADMDKDGDWDMVDVFAFVDALLTKPPCDGGGGGPIELHVHRCSEDVKPYFITPSPAPVILDSGSASHTFTVPEAGIIGDIDVDLHIVHEDVGDLNVTIEHLGTVVTLWNHGCAGNADMDVVFDDNGRPAVCAAPVVGNIIPVGSLAAFNGMNKQGDWTITVFDTVPLGCGWLVEWSMHFCNGDIENISVGRIHSVRHIVKDEPGDKCAGSIYHNGEPDGVQAVSAERRVDGSLVRWAIDDVNFAGDALIEDLHWWAVDDAAFNWTGLVDMIITEDLGGVPGATLYELLDQPGVRDATGQVMFGDPVYMYQLFPDPPIFLPAGSYFIGMRPVAAAPYNGQSFWATAPLSGSQIYLDYPPDNPAWTAGDVVFGAQYDVAFCVTGQMPAPEPSSSCCYPNGCTSIPPSEPDPESFCMSTGGISWHPEPCDSVPDPCADPVGACCWGPAGFQIQGCDSDVTSADCTAAHPGEVVNWNEGADCGICQGRCCVEAAGQCTEEYEAGCIALGGEPGLPGTACSDDECPCTYSVPWNDSCGDVTTPVLNFGETLCFDGNNACATNVSCESLDPSTWHAFTILDCMRLKIDLCNSRTEPGTGWIVIEDACPCGTHVFAESYTFYDCECGVNMTLYFDQNGLEAGTYYLPVHGGPDLDEYGDYTLCVTSLDSCGVPPVNDQCADAIQVLAGSTTA